MGREMRKVPSDWEHPKDKQGNYIPLHDGWRFKSDMEYWRKELKEFHTVNFRKHYPDAHKDHFWQCLRDWCGDKPLKSDYMPVWTEEEATHCMMYEDTSEGTPISPKFETPEELARWLADTRASKFADMPTDYADWMRIINGGFSGLIVRSIANEH
jgi:hypothetical protein